MDDIKYEYVTDIKQKKSTARGAKYKNRKHRGCSLPSDNLTNAQRKKMNGKMQEIDLNRHYTWKELKGFSALIQLDYINNLVRKWNCNNSQLMQALDISANSFYDIRKRITDATGRLFLRGRHNGVYDINLDAWERFLNNEELEESTTTYASTLPEESDILESNDHSEESIFITPNSWVACSVRSIICVEDLTEKERQRHINEIVDMFNLYVRHISGTNTNVKVTFKVERIKKGVGLTYEED